MGINYEKVNDEFVKIARGLGYTIEMYDEMGNGPISSTKNAKYIELMPDGIMLGLPTGSNADRDEIIIYAGTRKDMAKFLDLIHRCKIVAHMNGLEITIRKFDQPQVRAKDLAHLARAKREDGLSQ